MDMEAASRRPEIAVRRELGGQNSGGGRRVEESAAGHSGSRRAEETVKAGHGGGGSTSLSCEPDVIHILDSSPLLLQQVLSAPKFTANLYCICLGYHKSILKQVQYRYSITK